MTTMMVAMRTSGKEEGAQAGPYVGIHTFTISTASLDGWLRNLQQDGSGYHHHRRCVVTAIVIHRALYKLCSKLRGNLEAFQVLTSSSFSYSTTNFSLIPDTCRPRT